MYTEGVGFSNGLAYSATLFEILTHSVLHVSKIFHRGVEILCEIVQRANLFEILTPSVLHVSKIYHRGVEILCEIYLFINLSITIRRDARQNPIVQIMQLNWREA